MSHHITGLLRIHMKTFKKQQEQRQSWKTVCGSTQRRLYWEKPHAPTTVTHRCSLLLSPVTLVSDL